MSAMINNNKHCRTPSVSFSFVFGSKLLRDLLHPTKVLSCRYDILEEEASKTQFAQVVGVLFQDCVKENDNDGHIFQDRMVMNYEWFLVFSLETCQCGLFGL